MEERVIQTLSVFLAGSVLYTLILYRNSTKAHKMPSAYVHLFLTSRFSVLKNMHSGFVLHVLQGAEVTLDMLGISLQVAASVIAYNLRAALSPKPK